MLFMCVLIVLYIGCVRSAWCLASTEAMLGEAYAPSLRGILHNLHSAHGLLAIPASERWSGAEENSSKIRIFLKFLQHIAHICCGCKLHVAYFLVHSAAILSCPSLFRFREKDSIFSSHNEMLRGANVSAEEYHVSRMDTNKHTCARHRRQQVKISWYRHWFSY